MSKIRIYCFNNETFTKVRNMWFKENRIKRTMLKQFVRVECFDVDRIIRGVDIIIINELIQPDHLIWQINKQINKDLEKEGFTSKDFKVVVSDDE